MISRVTKQSAPTKTAQFGHWSYTAASEQHSYAPAYAPYGEPWPPTFNRPPQQPKPSPTPPTNPSPRQTRSKKAKARTPKRAFHDRNDVRYDNSRHEVFLCGERQIFYTITQPRPHHPPSVEAPSESNIQQQPHAPESPSHAEARTTHNLSNFSTNERQAQEQAYGSEPQDPGEQASSQDQICGLPSSVYLPKESVEPECGGLVAPWVIGGGARRREETVDSGYRTCTPDAMIEGI